MTILALLVGLLVFSVGYQLFSVQALIIGAALTYPESATVDRAQGSTLSPVSKASSVELHHA